MVRNNLLRVTQINAIFFDREIRNVLWQLAQDSLRNLPPGFTAPLEPELKFLINLATTCLSVVRINRTFGQKLLQVQYENLTNFKKAIYVLTDVLGYLKGRIEYFKPNHEINHFLSNVQMIIWLGSLLNTLSFLGSGRKPRLIERVLNVDQVYENDNIQRQFDTKYMTRELLWNGLIEILVYILPLINFHKVRRIVRKLNPLHKKPNVFKATDRLITFNTKCPQCQEYPVLPHHMGCAHIFCYSCLRGSQIADLKYECPVCEFSSSDNVCEAVYSQC